MPGQTAKQILGLADLRGDAIQGNVEVTIDSTGRTRDDFENNKIEWPAGEPFDQQLADRVV